MAAFAPESCPRAPKHAHVVLLMYFASFGVAWRFLCVTGNQSMGKRDKFAVGVNTT